MNNLIYSMACYHKYTLSYNGQVLNFAGFSLKI